MKQFGLEQEFLFTNSGISIEDVLAMELPGVVSEFYRCMIEVVTDTHRNAADTVVQLRDRVARLSNAGLHLEPKASLYNRAGSIVPAKGFTSMRDVLHPDDPYYQWVYLHGAEEASDFHHVGIHLNLSDSDMSEDELIHAVNMLRCFNWLFVLLSANSPYRCGEWGGYVSRRSYFYPNRYDVPLWQGAAECRAWLRAEEERGAIYPGKARCWMPVCPRLEGDDLNRPFSRIEVRSIDSGTCVSYERIESCLRIAAWLVDYSREHPLPKACDQIQENDLSVAKSGSRAMIWWNNQRRSARDVAGGILHQVSRVDGLPLETETLLVSPAEMSV